MGSFVINSSSGPIDTSSSVATGSVSAAGNVNVFYEYNDGNSATSAEGTIEAIVTDSNGNTASTGNISWFITKCGLGG